MTKILKRVINGSEIGLLNDDIIGIQGEQQKNEKLAIYDENDHLRELSDHNPQKLLLIVFLTL